MSTSSKKRGRNADSALAEQLIAGANKRLAGNQQILLSSGTFTPAQIVAQLQLLVNLRSDTLAARATAKAKTVAEDAQAPALRDFMVTFVSFVRTAFGNSPEVLADFGVDPKKAPTPLTVEEKVAAAAKRAATRAKRGTTSAKQKKLVKGDVTGVVVTPVTSGEQPVVAPANPPNGGSQAHG
jgi:hypothetical protein